MSHMKDYKVISSQTVVAACLVLVSPLSDLKRCFLMQGGAHADSWEEVKERDFRQEAAAGWGHS